MSIAAEHLEPAHLLQPAPQPVGQLDLVPADVLRPLLAHVLDARRQPGDLVYSWGPLGRGYSTRNAGQNLLLVGGGIGLFHVMALALVIGIGIDYGLLLTLSGDGAQFGAAVRSVLLCATTTLIGFITMALSGVGVLEDIGTTVAIGVLAMLATSAVRSHRQTGAR